MAGGEKPILDRVAPILKTLAPPDGFLYTGAAGSGHFVKMVHNALSPTGIVERQSHCGAAQRVWRVRRQEGEHSVDMLEWVTPPTLAEMTDVFCQRLDLLVRQAPGACPVALTGGGSAAVFYDAWAVHGVASQFRFYWSDERMVALDDPDSNFKLARDHLLSPGRVAPACLHPAPTGLPVAACAAAYADEIRQGILARPDGTPQFPLIILGMGADGHTGSLFPGRDPYSDDAQLVRAVDGTVAHPHARITFTPRLINAAAQVWFLVTGDKKAWALEQWAKRTASVDHVPALAVDPTQTHVTIFAR